MYNKQAFQSGNKGGCGSMGRGKWGGPWGRGKFGGFNRHWAGGFQSVPVNIEETDNEYIISLFAAGLVKENVTLAVKNDVLTVSYPTDTDSADTTDQAQSNRYTYQEYSHRGFERQFQLNNKVLTDGISATYSDGVLKVTLPKNPETNKPAQTITVA